MLILKKKPLNAKDILINTAGLFESALLILVISPPNIPFPPTLFHLEALLKPLMKMHKPRAYKCQFTVCIHGSKKKMPDTLILF